MLNGEYEIVNDYYMIEEYFIVQKVLKYYWNMNVFFDINQGDYLVVEKLVSKIKSKYDETHPTSKVWYDKIESYLKGNQLAFERIDQTSIYT